jgi:hypothetical protein
MPSAAPLELVLSPVERSAFLHRLARNLAPQDVLVVSFELYLWLRALLAPHGPGAIYARNVSFGLLASSVIAIALCRGELLPAGPLRAVLHRLGLALPLAGVYLALRRYLPALALEPCDGALLALDKRLFGETPAVLLERFATHSAVEWFAFCYYAYFFLIGGYVLGSLLRDHGSRVAELMLGIALVTALGQSLYTLVPGVGPHALGELFAQPLAGGVWWERVVALVARAGAGMDIFPSLHTAHPVLIALHAFRHRQRGAYRLIWLPTVLLACNMVVSTMFLRWHYGVDVLAGLTLAFVAQRAAVATVQLEGDRAQRQPAWELLCGAERASSPARLARR